MGLSKRASEIIKRIHEAANLGTQYKIGDDPVTDADKMTQYVIETKLREFYPGIKIVGEEDGNTKEDEEVIENLTLNPKIFDSFISESKEKIPNLESLSALNLPLSRACVYIDPLDATRSFVKGRMSNVSTLFTLCLDRRPVLGLIGFGYPDHQDVFEPRTYVSWKGLGQVLGFKNVEYDKIEYLVKYEKFNIEEKEGEIPQ